MKSLLAVVILGLATLARVCFADLPPQMFEHSPNVALALQYVSPTHLVGANLVRLRKSGELVVFDNEFQCGRWAQIHVGAEKNKSIGYGCMPVPKVGPKDTSRVALDPHKVGSPIEDIAVAFEYGTTHQLVVVRTLGRADDDADCIRKGRGTLAGTKIAPGWVVVIICTQVPTFPPATGHV